LEIDHMAGMLRLESLEDRWNLSSLDPFVAAAPEPEPGISGGLTILLDEAPAAETKVIRHASLVKIYCAPGDPS
jgi:hypothetical protein